jgi:acetyl esterase
MDDGVQAFMRATDQAFPAVETMTASRVRAVLAGRRPPIANVDDVAAVVDRRIPGPDGDLTVRVYRPHGHTGARPGVVFFHGGGLVFTTR